MFFWFAAFAVLVVLAVFDSPAMDYRYVVAGAVLPVVETMIGRPFLLHTLVGSVGALVIVAVVTRGRRLAARRLVGVPIGMFLHLVADGTWSTAKLFWWPFLGGREFLHGEVPELDHLGVSLVLEAIGLVAMIMVVRRYRLADREPLRHFMRTGRLDTKPKGRVC